MGASLTSCGQPSSCITLAYTCGLRDDDDCGQHTITTSDAEIWPVRLSGQSLAEEVELLRKRKTILEELQPDMGEDGYLGCSSLSTVVRSLGQNSDLRALKQINKKMLVGDIWKEEVAKLVDIEHPNICKLHDAWEDSKCVYLVMEFCSGGNLMSIAAQSVNFSETNVAVLVLQMVQAVSHLHEQGLVHGDLRPENWLFDKPVDNVRSSMDTCLKMIDFGVATKHGRRSRRTSSWRKHSFNSLGSNSPQNAQILSRLRSMHKSFMEQDQVHAKENEPLLCQAPEQVQETQAPPEASCDIWAIGVLAYFLLSGASPFEAPAGVDDPKENHSFLNAHYVFMPREAWQEVSCEAKHFIALCLLKDPAQRPKARKLLSMPWMRMAQDAVDRESRSPVMPSNIRVEVVSKDIDQVLITGPMPVQGTPLGARLSFQDPPLPMASSILESIDRRRRIQLNEYAAIIGVASAVCQASLPKILGVMKDLDVVGAGVITFPNLVMGLRQAGIQCKALEDLGSIGPVAYNDFFDEVSAAQSNMQESAGWYVFRCCDSESRGEVQKASLQKELGEEKNRLRRCLTAGFPGLHVDAMLSGWGQDPQGRLNYEEFHDLLQSAVNEQAIVSAGKFARVPSSNSRHR
eukprot:TRINITY_DN10054_c1_g1_i1.p1 TRINITY_DN10054_c1_g1~~TRINITY_DN10054_c1_g1_i1.p1  ORF type:complete len:631 (-),score=106.51 TRINITY_DN10054_c1_g1_i1:37-1929(-)